MMFLFNGLGFKVKEGRFVSTGVPPLSPPATHLLNMTIYEYDAFVQRFRVQVYGQVGSSGVQDAANRAEISGSRVYGPRFGVRGLGSRVSGLGFRVWVSGSGFRN